MALDRSEGPLAPALGDEKDCLLLPPNALSIPPEGLDLPNAAPGPTAFPEIKVGRGMKRRIHLLARPARFSKAPELFCLGLFPEFDLERLIGLASPARMGQRFQTTDGGN